MPAWTHSAGFWDKAANWYGDKIAAVHFKGQAFRPDGSHYSTSLEDSVIDYAGGFAMLRQLPQDSLPVLREEAVPRPCYQRHRLYPQLLRLDTFLYIFLPLYGP